MSHHFDESRHPEDLHPHALPLEIDGRVEVERLIDGEASPDVQRLADERAAKVISEFLLWLVRFDCSRATALNAIGRRAVAASWVVNPWIFESRETLRKIADHLGCSAANLSPETAEFSRLFRVSNAFQTAHDSATGRVRFHDAERMSGDLRFAEDGHGEVPQEQKGEHDEAE